MRNGIDTEFFVQHIQCTREQKMECLDTVRLLLDIAFTAREFGLLKLEELIRDHVRFSDRFLRKAVNLTIEISKPENIREVLYNYLFTSCYASNQQFLNGVIITETMVAVGQSESLDYIFTYLIPSYFGLDYEGDAIRIYRNYRAGLRKLDAAKAKEGEQA